MGNLISGINKWWLKKKALAALSRISHLERNRRFISPFFLGETKYKIEDEKNWSELQEARANFENLKQYL